MTRLRFRCVEPVQKAPGEADRGGGQDKLCNEPRLLGDGAGPHGQEGQNESKTF